MDERLKHEQIFHDEQAAQRRAGWENDPAQLLLHDNDYLDHEPWVRPAFARLGNLVGKHVLDFGCGHGMASTCLAQQGADVVAFDLSAGYVHEAVTRARAHGFHIHGVVADGARLPWACESFDAIWGVAILHHLNLANAVAEIHRVLRPGGVAVFCEPWGGNPLLQWARERLPYPGKERTPDEQPLMPQDLNQFKRSFRLVTIEHVQLLGMVRRAWRACPLVPVLDRCDLAILKHWPQVRQWSRYVIIQLEKS